MPERQSSPGEATAHPEPGNRENVRSTGGTEQAASGDAQPPSPVRTAERSGGEGARPAVAPRPSPRPAPSGPGPDGDESPTVRTPAPAARPANGEHANGR